MGARGDLGRLADPFLYPDRPTSSLFSFKGTPPLSPSTPQILSYVPCLAPHPFMFANPAPRFRRRSPISSCPSSSSSSWAGSSTTAPRSFDSPRWISTRTGVKWSGKGGSRASWTGRRGRKMGRGGMTSGGEGSKGGRVKWRRELLEAYGSDQYRSKRLLRRAPNSAFSSHGARDGARTLLKAQCIFCYALLLGPQVNAFEMMLQSAEHSRSWLSLSRSASHTTFEGAGPR